MYRLNCQALSFSPSLREKAYTIIIFHTKPHQHRKPFKDLRLDLYSNKIHHWNHLLNPISFPY